MKLKDVEIDIAGNRNILKLLYVIFKAALVVAVVFMISIVFYPSTEANNDCITGKVKRIKDGDTYVIDVSDWPKLFRSSSFRLREVDTPELRSRCKTLNERIAEKKQAVRAKMLAIDLLQGKEVLACDLGLDSFGRVLATINVGGVDVAKYLLEQKAAKIYVKGAKPWCGL